MRDIIRQRIRNFALSSIQHGNDRCKEANHEIRQEKDHDRQRSCHDLTGRHGLLVLPMIRPFQLLVVIHITILIRLAGPQITQTLPV